ncbi:MAG: hypothetical protein FWE45_01635 [Firmicutes bacterium]|nr:hypothetical protein [Bacillota bacterium]
MKERIIVIAYTGAGKTEMLKRYEGIYNPSSDDYRYIFDKDLPPEQRKSNPDRKENPEFPNNFIDAIHSGLDDNIVLLPLTKKLFELYLNEDFKQKMKGARIIVACPRKNDFAEYKKRFEERGNIETFIENRQKEFSFIMDTFENMQDFEKIIIKPGQFLDQALIGHGIQLKPK